MMEFSKRDMKIIEHYESQGIPWRKDYIRCKKCKKSITNKQSVHSEESLWIDECEECDVSRRIKEGIKSQNMSVEDKINSEITCEGIHLSKEDITDILSLKLGNIEEKLSFQINKYCENVLEKIADSAYSSAKYGYFWNKEIFKEFMKETIYELFFSQPEVHDEFKKMITNSFKQIFENWTTSTLIEMTSTDEYITKMKSLRKNVGK